MEKRVMISIAALAFALLIILAVTNPVSTGAKKTVNIGTCTTKVEDVYCNDNTASGTITLPKNIGGVRVKESDGVTIVYIDVIGSSKTGCPHRFEIRGYSGVIVFRIVENNVPYTVGKLDVDNCKWILR